MNFQSEQMYSVNCHKSINLFQQVHEIFRKEFTIFHTCSYNLLKDINFLTLVRKFDSFSSMTSCVLKNFLGTKLTSFSQFFKLTAFMSFEKYLHISTSRSRITILD